MPLKVTPLLQQHANHHAPIPPEEVVMHKCDRLFPAESFNAYYDAARKQVVVSAEVTFNLYSDDVHICPNPLARILPTPEYREFLVGGSTRPGIHPMMVTRRTVFYSYASDLTPAKVRVYSMGVDNPAASDVPVGNKPPVMVQSTPQKPPAQPGQPAVKPTGPWVAIGWSQAFKFDEAFADAVARVLAIMPFRHPDVATTVKVVEIGGEVGGFVAQHGMYVKVSAD
jgi:hypothetical protein